MHKTTALRRLSLACAGILAGCAAIAAAGLQAPAHPHAITWPGQRAAVEAWLRDAPILRFEAVPIGVTRPQRAFFEAGGLVRSAAWKPLRPGFYKGYWESYKSEIAAYELDKLLELDMVPPTVERSVGGLRGALVMWVDGVKGWNEPIPVVPVDGVAWSRQIVRMKMFDELIANIDRNQGNLLYDSDFHVVLIDHSRAFTAIPDIRKMSAPTRFDARLWERMGALTSAQLQSTLGPWLGKPEIAAILKRRERMRVQLAEIIRTHGEELAFIR